MWIVLFSIALFGELPYLLHRRLGWTSLSDAIYIATGIAILWYTIETSYLRRAMVLANEIAVLPLVTAGIEWVQSERGTHAESVVLRNIGKGVALSVRAADFDLEKTDLGTLGNRIEGPDVIEPGQTVAVESFGYLAGDNEITKKVADTLVSHLKPTAQKTQEITISYEDIAGGKHESVVRMGKGGIRLLSPHFQRRPLLQHLWLCINRMLACGARLATKDRTARMNQYALVGLILNIVGTAGVGFIPFFGTAAGYGGLIVFSSPLWACAWGLAWLVFLAGATLSARASR